MVLLTIGGVVMPEITEYAVNYEDIESESGGESETGKTVRDVVRKNKCSIDVTFKVDGNKLKQILTQISEPSFTVNYFDTLTMAVKTTTMYQQQKQNSLVSLAADNGLWELALTLYEF